MIPEARPTPRRLVAVLPLPGVAGVAPIDVAEAFRDLPGLALLESARPGRTGRWSFLTADPVAVLDAPAEGDDPFAEARALLRRMAPVGVGGSAVRPPFAGGLVGYLGYDLGRRFERLPSLAVVDQHLPVLRLALHDWVIAWDRRSGVAWLASRSVDSDHRRARRRADEALERVRAFAGGMVSPGSNEAEPPPAFVSGTSRAAWIGGVETIRAAIGRGEIYQANLTRRLEAPFSA